MMCACTMGSVSGEEARCVIFVFCMVLLCIDRYLVSAYTIRSFICYYMYPYFLRLR